MKKRRKTHDPPPERAVCDPIGPEPHDVRVALRAQPDEDVAQIRCGFFLANKATLTSISDFFARMFDNGMAETTAAKVRVVLPDAGCAIQFCRVLSAAIHGTPNWGDGGGQPSLVVVAQVMALADQVRGWVAELGKRLHNRLTPFPKCAVFGAACDRTIQRSHHCIFHFHQPSGGDLLQEGVPMPVHA